MLLAAQTLAANAGGPLVQFGLASIIVGSGWFLHGFRALRVQRRVANTAVARCDALAVGKVALCGTARADRPMPALFSGLECVFSQATIHKWEGEAGRGQWVHLATVEHPPRASFTLNDGSGEAVVLPAGATLQLRSTRYESGDEMAVGGSALLAAYDGSGTTRFRIDEMQIDQGAAVYVLGFATEAPMVASTALPLTSTLPKGKLVIWNKPGTDGFMIADETPKELAQDLGRKFNLGMIGGPVAMLTGVAALAWLFFSSPLGHDLSIARVFTAFGVHPRTTTLAIDPTANVQALDGTTALMRAAHAASAAKVSRLLAVGADANIVDVHGRTALHYAVLTGSAATVNAVLAAKPFVSIQDDTGNTPLHLAAQRGSVAIVDALLAAGADPGVPNLQKQTPLDIARQSRAPVAATITTALRNASHL